MASVNFNEGTNVKITINKGPLDGGNPGGSANTVQYNDNGVFNGITGVTTDGTKLITSNVNIAISGGNTGQVLSTDGTGNLSWINVATGSGTVTSVTGTGSGLGFSLSGTVTDSGNITLTTPDSANLRTSLNIGNIANLNLNGNNTQYLDGTGNWATIQTSAGGSNTNIQFNDDGAFNGVTTFTFDKTTNIMTVGNINSVDSITFDTANTTAGAVGRFVWNDGDGTINLGLKGGNVTAHIGQNLYTLVYNDAGAQLSKGQVVYISGAQGQRPSVKLALATGDNTSARTLGIVAETIAIGAEGLVCIEGDVDNINTDGLTEGGQLYLSPTTPGGYTQNKPSAPYHMVYVGIVLKANQSSGRIQVKVQNGYELDEIHDVAISNVAASDMLSYDSVTSLWKNSNVATVRSNLSIGNIANINLNGSNTQYLDGTGNWVTIETGTDTLFRENPSNVFSTNATANSAWANVIGNYAGNINYTGSNISLGPIGNINITGGTSGQYIRVSDTSILEWANIDGVEGSLQFKHQSGNGNYFYGTDGLIFDVLTNTLKVGATAGTGGNIHMFTGISNVGPLRLRFGPNASEYLAPDTTDRDGYDFNFNGGSTTDQARNGGTLRLFGGTGGNVGGNVLITAGTGGNVGGSVIINPGPNSNSTQYGNITLETLGLNLTLVNGGAISLNGNVGNVGQVLTSNGSNSVSWTTPTVGTVTSVVGDGSGLGFSLSGTVTSSGNITLSIPTDTELRTSLNIGNVANINLNGNSSTVLSGNGTWVAQSGGGGATEVISPFLLMGA